MTKDTVLRLTEADLREIEESPKQYIAKLLVEEIRAYKEAFAIAMKTLYAIEKRPCIRTEQTGFPCWATTFNDALDMQYCPSCEAGRTLKDLEL